MIMKQKQKVKKSEEVKKYFNPNRYATTTDPYLLPKPNICDTQENTLSIIQVMDKLGITSPYVLN